MKRVSSRITILWFGVLCLTALGVGACGSTPILTSPGSERIQGHVYDFFDRARSPRPAFGLYTYVLFPDSGTQSRNAALLQAIRQRTSPLSEQPTEIPTRQLNIFMLPVTDRSGARETAADAAVFFDRRYDYQLARSILDAFCASHQDDCEGPSQGPYLLTYDRPVTSRRLVASERWLLVDLSRIHQRAFPLFVAKLKAHLVTEPDFSARFGSLYTTFLSIVLTSADWIPPVGDGIREIVRWFEGQ